MAGSRSGSGSDETPLLTKSQGDEAVVIYTTAYCGYCRAAMNLLSQRNIAFERIDITFDPSTRRWLRGATGHTTVPQVFIGGRNVGGFRELSELAECDGLEPLVASAVAARRANPG